MKKSTLIFLICLITSVTIKAQENLKIAEVGTWGDSVNASITYDHFIARGLYIGYGAGVTWNFSYPVSYPENGTIGKTYYSRVLVPVYASVRYYPNSGKFKPFLDFKGGLLSDYTHKEVGFFLRPAVGYEIRRFDVNLGFEYNNLKYSPLKSGDYLMRPYLGFSMRF